MMDFQELAKVETVAGKSPNGGCVDIESDEELAALKYKVEMMEGIIKKKDKEVIKFRGKVKRQ